MATPRHDRRSARTTSEDVFLMNFKANLSAQGILTMFHGLNLGMLTGKLQIIAGVLIAIVQAVGAAQAHWSNPDGTPAELPYYKPTDKI